jgi:hypothetical protein
MPKQQDTAESLLRELATHLTEDAEVKGSKTGTLPLSKNEGDLWRRIIDFLGGEPDIIHERMAPHIERQA